MFNVIAKQPNVNKAIYLVQNTCLQPKQSYGSPKAIMVAHKVQGAKVTKTAVNNLTRMYLKTIYINFYAKIMTYRLLKAIEVKRVVEHITEIKRFRGSAQPLQPITNQCVQHIIAIYIKTLNGITDMRRTR